MLDQLGPESARALRAWVALGFVARFPQVFSAWCVSFDLGRCQVAKCEHYETWDNPERLLQILYGAVMCVSSS